MANPNARRAGGAHARYPEKIRIIAGQWRGRKLPVLTQQGLRPTPDRVRETLFNWLAPVIEGASCLDLFAGTGALCLEALSRGAAHVTMVERAEHVAAQLRRNIEMLGASGAEVIQGDAAEFLGCPPPRRYDVIFLDPPFASDLIARCAELVARNNWATAGGYVYVEAPASLRSLPLPAHWEIVRSKRAGQVGYHLARVAPAQNPDSPKGD